MKIIFLDIDGVLNYGLYYKNRTEIPDLYSDTYPLSEICPKAIGLLNNLIEKTGAKVVISSTWRMNSTQEQLQNILNERGFTGEIIDYTPIFQYTEENKYSLVRGNEIQYWIDTNLSKLRGGRVQTEYKNYVIFDDDDDMLYTQRNNFIHVSPYTGLTQEYCNRAEAILNS